MSSLVSDGDRYAAWQRGSSLTVLDSRTGIKKLYAAPAGCYPVDLAAGTVLLSCSDAGATIDIVTGLYAGLPAPAIDPGQAATPTYRAIGRYWASVRVFDYRGGYDLYVSRRDPLAPPRPPTTQRNQVADLDVPHLTRQLCAPVQATNWLDPSGLGLEPAPFAYSPPYAAGPSDTAGPEGASRLLLWRCGHRAQVLDNCSCVPSLGGGWIHWSSTERTPRDWVVRVRRLSGGATQTWRFESTYGQTAHVRDRLLVAQDQGLFTVRLPR